MSNARTNLRHWQWVRIRIGLVGLFFVAALSLLLIIPILPTGQVTYEAGDVARADIRAPHRLEYQSQIQTDQERSRAAAAVIETFDPPENRIALQQITRAQDILAFIGSVREDTFSTTEERIDWIQAIPDPDLHLTLTIDRIEQIMALNDSDWAKVREEVVRVLDQAMRDSIRGEDLLQVRARVHTLVDFRRLNDEQVSIVSTLVRGLVVPNTFINVEQTEAARQKARDEVKPIVRSFAAEEIVLREGDTITDLDLEALRELGLLQTAPGWRELGGVLTLVLLTTSILALAWLRYQPDLLTGRSRNVALVALLFIAFVLIAKVMTPGRAVLPYLFPAAALSMLVTVLVNPELAIVATLVLAGLVGNITGNSLELAVYIAASGVMAALVLRRVERVNAFFRTGVYVGITNVIVVLIFRLPNAATDAVGIMTLTAMGIVNGALAASLTLAVFFIVGNLLDITTALKLLELSQPSHPLMRQLLLKAPGTYHHTLLIANLAEQAAERIEADALLTRVGAFYHDIGKTVRPHFFTENQMDGVNPHDRLDPYTTAEILSAHVADGLDLAKRYRLPSRIRAFISEHHGDWFVSYMYRKAVEEAGGDASQVDENRFRYMGPKPQSKETALLMLADTTEAITKSKRPGSVAELVEVVNQAVKMRMEQGQLDECGLTLRDLKEVRESFIDTLKGLYHSRIEYPESKLTAGTGGETDSEAQTLRVEEERPGAAQSAEALLPTVFRSRERNEEGRDSIPSHD